MAETSDEDNEEEEEEEWQKEEGAAGLSDDEVRKMRAELFAIQRQCGLAISDAQAARKLSFY